MVCSTCEEIKRGISPAVLEIDAASNNSVDDARVLIERAPLVAQGGRFKLYIIDECHMLTKEAFNALLKTIEEPPPKVIFVLATTEEHKEPPTIISRCQRLMFRLANHEELSRHLRKIADIEEISIEDDALDLIARRSGGGLRDALGLLDQASLLATKQKPATVPDLLALLGAVDEDVLLKMSEAIRDHDAGRVLQSVNGLLAQGREPSLVALELSKHFLNLAKAYHASLDQANDLRALITGSKGYIESCIESAQTFEAAELTQMVERLDQLESQLRRASQPALTLESGLLNLCHRNEILLVKQLAKRVADLEASMQSGVSYVAPHPVAHAPAPIARPTPAQVSSPAPVSAPAPAPASAQAQPPHSDSPPPPGPKAPVAENTHEQQAASAPPTNHGTRFNEVDQFWSAMMDYLQQKHLPTYSLVSQFGFPLALTDTELVIGVPKEAFVKMLENKAEFLKTAARNIDGRDIFIKVKVQADGVPPARPPQSGSPRETQSPQSQPPVASSSMAQSQDEEDDLRRPAKLSPAPAARQKPPAMTGGDSDEALMVKEAYKLFEGPGSRFIS